MFVRRWILAGLAVLAVVGLIFAGGARAERQAWFEGYTLGRLAADPAAAGSAAVAAAAPYAGPTFGPSFGYGYGYAYGPGFGPRFGGLFFLAVILGLASLAAFRCRRAAQWQAWQAQGDTGNPEAGAQAGRRGWGPHGPWGTPPPWAYGGHGPAQAQQGQQPQKAQQPQTGGPQGDRPAADAQPAEDR